VPSDVRFSGVEALEDALSAEERSGLHGLLQRALLAVVAPCGVLLTHGAPDESLVDLRALDDVPLDVAKMTTEQRLMTRALLTSYGQTDAVATAMLSNVSRGLGFDVTALVHGHDREESGFFREGKHQLCPCIFGAPAKSKRYVRLDLGARYRDVDDLRDGAEIRRLYTSPPVSDA
jgi:hypothetical protein